MSVGGGYFVSVIGAAVTDLRLRGAHCQHPSAKKQPAHIATKGEIYIFRCETRETTCEDSSATLRQRPEAEDAGANFKFIPVDRRVDRSVSTMHESTPFQLKTDTCILKQLLKPSRCRFYSGITPESYTATKSKSQIPFVTRQLSQYRSII